ncbi:hypothetical protein [Micromonospora sp. CPCC 206061]|uniref:hypothetical protein n=1 Tax=Micromonospora sp. CPCC 206061 TaxID=3122410 RepID=UPI002FF32400
MAAVAVFAAVERADLDVALAAALAVVLAGAFFATVDFAAVVRLAVVGRVVALVAALAGAFLAVAVLRAVVVFLAAVDLAAAVVFFAAVVRLAVVAFAVVFFAAVALRVVVAFDVVDLRAGAFFAVVREAGAVFFAAAFLAGAFLAVVVALLAVARFAGAFFAAALLVTVFRAVVFVAATVVFGAASVSVVTAAGASTAVVVLLAAARFAADVLVAFFATAISVSSLRCAIPAQPQSAGAAAVDAESVLFPGPASIFGFPALIALAYTFQPALGFFRRRVRAQLVLARARVRVVLDAVMAQAPVVPATTPAVAHEITVHRETNKRHLFSRKNGTASTIDRAGREG